MTYPVDEGLAPGSGLAVGSGGLAVGRAGEVRIPVVAITGAAVGVKRVPLVDGPMGGGGPIGGPPGAGVLGVCVPAGGGCGRPLEPAS